MTVWIKKSDRAWRTPAFFSLKDLWPSARAITFKGEEVSWCIFRLRALPWPANSSESRLFKFSTLLTPTFHCRWGSSWPAPNPKGQFGKAWTTGGCPHVEKQPQIWHIPQRRDRCPGLEGKIGTYYPSGAIPLITSPKRKGASNGWIPEHPDGICLSDFVSRIYFILCFVAWNPQDWNTS